MLLPPLLPLLPLLLHTANKLVIFIYQTIMLLLHGNDAKEEGVFEKIILVKSVEI